MANFNLDDYVPVHERIEKFYATNPAGRILTNIERLDDGGLVLFKASVYRSNDDAEPASTGHAYEQANSSYINKTSHIENCETSAIGRALANLGIEVSRGIASREEMQKVERMQKANGSNGNSKSDAMRKRIKELTSQLNEVNDSIKWRDATINEYCRDSWEADYLKMTDEQLTAFGMELKKRLETLTTTESTTKETK